MSDIKPVRRRSSLLQERSRRTRQRLIRAALDTWAERGFETGVEVTTVDEIVQAAGVTKGTFYFHFARKEEILLEMGWDTAEVVNEEIRRCIKSGRAIDDSFKRVIAVLSRYVRAAPPLAVGRALAEFRRTPYDEIAAHGRATFSEGLTDLMAAAQSAGQVRPACAPGELARMIQAIWMECILDWTAGEVDLSPALRRRTTILLDGMRAQGSQ